MSKIIALLLSASLSAALAAQVQNAGVGAIYRSIQLNPLTGNDGHLGCAVRQRDGHIFVSARGPGGAPPHKIYELSETGVLLGSFNQPSVHDSSPWGIRDLAVDNAGNLIGGSENGITIFDSQTGALVNSVSANNGPQPVVQPIRGLALGSLGTFHGMAFDPSGDGGNGSLWSASFHSALIEFNLAGDPLHTFQAANWSIYGIAIDPVTGNLLVNSAPDFGRISEVASGTGLLTGRSIPMALPGVAGVTLQGGLSLASSTAGVHERWFSEVNLVELTQNTTSDVLSIRRLHLYHDDMATPPRNGWNETNLQSAVGATGTLDTSFKTFTDGATLRLKVNDPTNASNGFPAWVIFNMFGDANVDAYTDLTGLFPGAGVLVEQRCLNPLSTPSSPFFIYTTVSIGTAVNLPTPAGIFQVGDRLRLQALYLQPLLGGPLPLASTNEMYFTRQ